MRWDLHLVNGLRAFKLGLENTTTYAFVEVYYEGSSAAYYDIEIAVRHADGTETELLPWTQFAYRDVSGEGFQTYSFNCPETNLSPTDAVVVRLRTRNTGGSDTAAFITEQLGAGKLPAATWTFHVYTYCYRAPDGSEAAIYWGDAAHNTRVENFTWTPPVAVAPRLNPAILARSRALKRP